MSIKANLYHRERAKIVDQCTTGKYVHPDGLQFIFFGRALRPHISPHLYGLLARKLTYLPFNNKRFSLDDILIHIAMLSHIGKPLVEGQTTLLTLARNYAFKSDLKIKWVRPEKIPCYKPSKSGDLETFPILDKTQCRVQFQNSEELKTADEIVKKLLSLEYAPRKETATLYRQNMQDRVKRHEFDFGSAEVKLAKWTGTIRAWQEIMERFPKNKGLKIKLKELIDKRKKHLKYVRRWDYKRYEWLLEALNLENKAHPEKYHWITRKESLKKLTDKYCNEIREERLKTYKLNLQAEQPEFLKEKINCLEFIRQEQKDCNVEQTVTEEEIELIRKQLSQMLKEREDEKEID